jgi:eukaryotic-like serine/threonine-protein kinase
LRTPFGHIFAIADETDITASHEIVPPAAAPPPPPGGRPPRFLGDDVWPWLAALGVLVIAGLLVWLFVLRDNGNKGKVVPAVVGLQQQQAIAKLTADGFSVNAIVGPADKPRGIVVSQVPGGGSRVGKNQKVTLHISNGRSITQTTTATTTATTTTSTQTATTTTTQTTTQSQQIAVPDVSGQDLKSATGQIEAAGFVAETDPVTDSATQGTVTQQDPTAGTQAPAGSIVRLSIAVGSNRPSTNVPNIVGQKASAARASLVAAKLTVKTVYKQGKIGVVLAETPTGSVPAYTQVTISVGN